VDDVVSAERGGDKIKIDYREVLDVVTFKRFSDMREIRKRVGLDEGVPPYAVFTDAELAELAKMEVVTSEVIKNIKGIGEKKLEKYGHHFITKTTDAPSK
jgi:superfamily II DNA helicase RecQ